MRDVQRVAVWKAEREALDDVFRLGREGNEDIQAEMCYFDNITEAQGYADVVCDRMSLPRVAVSFVTGKDAMILDLEVSLPPWARQRFTLLHELAHHMTPVAFPAHGAEYVEHYLMLLRLFMPLEVSKLCLDRFLDHGVTVTPSPSQALRFLAYVRRLASPRKIQVVTDSGMLYFGQLESYERTGNVVLKGETQVVLEAPSASLRYASWAA